MSLVICDFLKVRSLKLSWIGSLVLQHLRELVLDLSFFYLSFCLVNFVV